MKLQKVKATEKLAEIGAFAVVRVETVERGLEIADGLVKGGVPAMEISYTNVNAGDVIAAVKAKYGDKICVGAGTVMEAATARLAIMAGAEFVVSNMESELVKLFKTPTPWMPLMASGGINLDNLAEWVRSGVDTCGMGSLLTKGSADEIAKNAAEVRRIIDETRAEMGE